MIDQVQFAPARAAEPEQPPPPLPALTRQQVSEVACEVARQLGALQPVVLSCLRARLVDAKSWIPALGPDEAAIWWVILRGNVEVPRTDGGTYRGSRLEVAIDAVSGRAVGFRLAE